MAAGDPDHPAARAVRAARAYSGMSRTQLGEHVGITGATIGRYERGEWNEGPPKAAILESIARRSGILNLIAFMDAIGEEPDAARRFAAAARREAQRRSARPSSGPGAQADEGAEGEGR